MKKIIYRIFFVFLIAIILAFLAAENVYTAELPKKEFPDGEYRQVQSDGFSSDFFGQKEFWYQEKRRMDEDIENGREQERPYYFSTQSGGIKVTVRQSTDGELVDERMEDKDCEKDASGVINFDFSHRRTALDPYKPFVIYVSYNQKYDLAAQPDLTKDVIIDGTTDRTHTQLVLEECGLEGAPYRCHYTDFNKQQGKGYPCLKIWYEKSYIGIEQNKTTTIKFGNFFNISIDLIFTPKKSQIWEEFFKEEISEAQAKDNGINTDADWGDWRETTRTAVSLHSNTCNALGINKKPEVGNKEQHSKALVCDEAHMNAQEKYDYNYILKIEEYMELCDHGSYFAHPEDVPAPEPNIIFYEMVDKINDKGEYLGEMPEYNVVCDVKVLDYGMDRTFQEWHEATAEIKGYDAKDPTKLVCHAKYGCDIIHFEDGKIYYYTYFIEDLLTGEKGTEGPEVYREGLVIDADEEAGDVIIDYEVSDPGRVSFEFVDVLKVMDYYRSNGIDDETADKVEKKITKILTSVTNIGMVVSVVILAAYGIKYMLASLEERAEIKKELGPYMIGAALLFGILAFTNVFMKWGENIANL